MKPSYWGPYFWKVIHITAMNYPSVPTSEDKEIYRKFYILLGDILPCSKCSKNYKRHLTTIPIEYFLKNNEELFKWTIHLHNIVNKELGKPQWSLEYAEAYYKNDRKDDKTQYFQKDNSLTFIIYLNITVLIALFILIIVLSIRNR